MELYKSKEKRRGLMFRKEDHSHQIPEETEKEYYERIAKWIKRTAKLVYLVRSREDVWEFPKKGGGIRW